MVLAVLGCVAGIVSPGGASEEPLESKWATIVKRSVVDVLSAIWSVID